MTRKQALTVQHITDTFEREISPLSYAESWDNVGLLVGSPEFEVRTVMLTIDFTEEVVDEAIQAGAELVFTYHPVMFKPIQRITTRDPQGRLLLKALRAGMSIYSPHTALDAAPDGISDWLADAVGQGYRKPLQSHHEQPKSQQFKLVTFVPEDEVDRLRNALTAAGAGRIGNYNSCSFTVSGTGTFRGNENSNPAVGQPGALEHVPEVRLEMVCSGDALPLLTTALKQFHPYEEPAFDIYALAPTPSHNTGAGRKVVLDQASTVGEIAQRIKDHLELPTIRMTDPNRPVKQIGLIPGSGVDLLDLAISEKCDLFITGELSYHRVLNAEFEGCSIILTGHTESERGYLLRLRSRMQKLVPQANFVVSTMDRPRFTTFAS